MVERQLEAALPELGAAEIARIARGAYAHLGRTTIETAILPSYNAAEIVGLFESVSGWELVEAAFQRSEGNA